jgi:hypothetical protein
MAVISNKANSLANHFTNMSDKDLGKKLVEEEQLFQFLEAYQIVTGESLAIICRGESPDFICERPSGQVVGIELARSPHDHDMVVYDRIWGDRTKPNFDLIASVTAIIAEKEQKRVSPHWRTPQSTILAIQLLDYTFESFRWFNDASFADDFCDTEFLEIWLADHSTIEAYGQVRLIGLHPPRWWGTHFQPALEGKPYG